MKSMAALILLLAAAPDAGAQQRVEERRPAPANGVVEIETSAGSVRVIGWDREEIAVTGTLGRGAEGLQLDRQGRRTHIEVETRGNPHGVKSDLEIRVPAGSRLSIESYDAALSVKGVKGAVKAESVNGSIAVTGEAQDVEASTVNGRVDVTCACTRVRAESVNGAVSIEGASGDLAASTVNGALRVAGGAIARAQLETVNGRIRLEADLDRRAKLGVETVGGAVELVFPANVSADFDVSSFSGEIVNELSAAVAVKPNKWTSQKELRFSLGTGGATVSVSTLSGNVYLRKRGGPPSLGRASHRGENAMRHGRAIGLAAAALAAAAPGLRAGEDEFRWNGRLAAGAVLEVKGVNGEIEAAAASGGDAEVAAVKTGRRSDPAQVEIKVVEHAGGVTVCAVYPSPAGERPNECRPGSEGRMNTRNNDVSVHFVVRVPAGVRFVGRTVNGSVEALSLGADAEAYTVNGGIRIESKGHARAETVNGSIHAFLGRADWTGSLVLHTVNGGITLTLPGNADAEVRARTVNGDIETDFGLAVEGRFSRRRLSGTLGRGGRQLELETVNGSIRLRRSS